MKVEDRIDADRAPILLSKNTALSPDIDTVKRHARTRFEARVRNLFPADAEAIFALCIHRDYPLGYNHPDVMAEILGVEFADDIMDDLRAAYVFLSAYYFLMDAVADGHVRDRAEPLYLSHLMSGGCLLYVGAFHRLAPDCIGAMQRVFWDHVSGNARAIREESILQAHSLEPRTEDDYRSIIGRSNSALLFYHIAALLSARRVDPDVVALLQEAIYYFQLADDLQDWQEDYDAGRFSSTLRVCFRRHERTLDASTLHDAMWLGGYYEERAAIIATGLESVVQRFQELPGVSSSLLQTAVQAGVRRATGNLARLVAAKLSAAAV